MKINIGAKIIGGYLLAVVILMIIGITSYRNTNHLIMDDEAVAHTNEVKLELNLLLSSLKDAETGQRGYLLTGDDNYLEPYDSGIASVYSRIEDLQSMIRTDDQIILLNSIVPLVKRKIAEMDSTITLRRDVSFEAAKAIVLTNAGKEDMDKIREVLNEMLGVEDELLALRGEEAKKAAKATLMTVIIGVPIGIIILALVGLIISRNITVPLGKITETAVLIAKGEISGKNSAHSERTDEVGVLLRAFKDMTEYLEDMAEAAEKIALGNLSLDINSKSEKDIMGNSFMAMQKSLRIKEGQAQEIANGNLTLDIQILSDDDAMGLAFKTMVENLRVQLNEISEGIGVLASSSSEIMASVTQLASSSAETATSVGETTITVEEVKQTAEVSNQKAKAVSENAVRTTEISAEGTKAIANTIEGMNKIRHQMTEIASMVVRLSEQSQTIGEITASVNELAEQSNLLAVNAAIEAAKAGEQGKGFTVVAQEIKMLADRSKEATAQVRTILREVQKSISSAVMATEEGGKAVDQGLQLTALSGDTIKTLSESVSEAAKAAIQIAASSQQQLEGMDQVVSAMENIKEASVQSAASTQQSVESVNELQKVGQKLDQLMKQYKLV